MTSVNRRAFIAASAGAATGLVWSASPRSFGIGSVVQPEPGGASSPHASFPAQDPELVRQIVGVSHGNFDAVKALVEKNRELAKAAWDWGFGDWESALGAASHVGNRPIAEYLIANGARPDLFTFAMLGHVDVVRAYVEAVPGIQKIHGPHGITLLSHAKAGGEQAASVVDYLQSVGGADDPEPSEPLEASLFATYIGDYRFGAGDADKLLVKEQRGSLFIERPGGAARGLRFTGDHTFTPAGAVSVKVIFDVEVDAASSLRIEGYSPAISAKRA